MWGGYSLTAYADDYMGYDFDVNFNILNPDKHETFNHGNLVYSTDGGNTWSTPNNDAWITLNYGDKLYIKGTDIDPQYAVSGVEVYADNDWRYRKLGAYDYYHNESSNMTACPYDYKTNSYVYIANGDKNKPCLCIHIILVKIPQYNVNLSIFAPGSEGKDILQLNNSEVRPDGNWGWGYIRASSDNKNWSDEMTNESSYKSQTEPFDFLNRSYGDTIYIKYSRPYYNYLEFKSIRGFNGQWYALPSVGNNIFLFVVKNNAISYASSGYGNYYYGGAIEIYMDYKHTTLTIDPNGGTINGSSEKQALSPQMQYSTANWNTLSGKPTRPGYTFEGWYDAATGGMKVYAENGSCIRGTKYFDNNGNSLCVDDLTVYAHWTKATYNIYYTLFGSTASIKRTYDITTNTFTLPTPSLSGYTFKGWVGGVDKNDTSFKNDSTDPASLRKTVTIDKGSFGDYFFRAIFEKNHSFSDGINVDDVYITQSIPKETFYKINSYRISYNLNGG